MSKLIHNVQTGEIETKPLTQNDIEIAQIMQEQMQAKENAKTVAQTKLLALGLTVEDLEALNL